jgi:hypothetical protein
MHSSWHCLHMCLLRSALHRAAAVPMSTPGDAARGKPSAVRVPPHVRMHAQDAYASHLARDDGGAIAGFLDDPTVRILTVSTPHQV